MRYWRKLLCLRKEGEGKNTTPYTHYKVEINAIRHKRKPIYSLKGYMLLYWFDSKQQMALRCGSCCRASSTKTWPHFLFSFCVLQISFGGMPVSAKPSSGGRENFVGCMEGITYNGDNITNLVKRKKIDTSSFVRTFMLFFVYLSAIFTTWFVIH